MHLCDIPIYVYTLEICLLYNRFSWPLPRARRFIVRAPGLPVDLTSPRSTVIGQLILLDL